METTSRKKSGGLAELFKRREVLTFILMIAVIIFAYCLSSSFRDLSYIFKCACRNIELSMAALPLTFIIIMGMMDLSGPAIMCVSATIAGEVFVLSGNMGAGIVCGLLVGLALGAVNGVLISILNLPSMIATIGTMNAFRGIAQILIGDKSLGHLPDWFNSIEKIKFIQLGKANFSITLTIFAVMCVVAYLILHRTAFGRHVYAIGINEATAICSGVNTRKVKMIIFSVAGVLYAFAGMLTMSRLNLVRYDMHEGSEIDVVTMVLLGGTNIMGGSGSILGTVFAVVMIIILKTGLIVANVSDDKQKLVMGVVLLISVIVPNIQRVLKERKDN